MNKIISISILLTFLATSLCFATEKDGYISDVNMQDVWNVGMHLKDGTYLCLSWSATNNNQNNLYNRMYALALTAFSNGYKVHVKYSDDGNYTLQQLQAYSQ